MNKEIIAEFGIDIDDLVSEAQIVKKTLDGLREQNKQVAKSQGTSSRAFIENSAEIKKLNTQYQTYIKALGVATNAEDSLNDVLKEKNTSIDRARENNKLLLKSRNALDLSTKKGIETQKAINDKIAENNKFIKENVTELEKQKIGIGGYEKAISNVLDKYSLFGVSLNDIRKNTSSFGEKLKESKSKLKEQAVASGVASTGLKGLRGAFASASLSAKAFSISLISTGVGAFVVAIGAMVAVMIKATQNSMEFAKEQSKLTAILGKTKKETESLKELTKELGRETEFTATQATQGAVELAKAGFSQSEIMESLANTLQLASAGNISLAESADIASNVVSGFGLKASDTQKVVDILAKSSTSANVTVTSMGESFKEIASTASVLDVSIEEVASVIDSLGNSGIKGANATNVLQSSLLRLADPTEKAKKQMNQLGVEFFDVNGDFIGMTKTISTLEGAFEGLTKEQQLQSVSAIFGKQSANQWLTVMNSTKDVLAKDLTPETRELLKITDENSKVTLKGSDVLKMYTSEMENASGSAKRLAEEMQNNLTGDITKLSSAWDGLFLSIEDGDGILTDISRAFVQLATETISGLTKSLFNINFAWGEFKFVASETLDFVLNQFKFFGTGVKLAVSKIPLIGKALGLDTETIQKDFNTIFSSLGSYTDNIKERMGSIELRYNNKDQERIENESKESDEDRKKRIQSEQKVRDENIKKTNKAQQDAIKQQETHLKLIQLISSVENTTIQEKQQSLKDVLAEELKIIDAKEKAGLSQDEAEIMRIEARQAALEGNTELILNAANKELEIYLLNNQHILDNEDNLNAEVLKKKKAFIDEKARLEIAALKAEGLSKDEYQAKRREIERQRDETKTQEDNDFKQAKSDEDKELEALAYEEKILLLEERDATEFEIKQERLIRDEELEVGALKQKLANKKITQEAYDIAIGNVEAKAAASQLDLDAALAKAKIDNKVGVLNAVSQIAGEETVVGKAAAIASTTISTYQSAQSAFQSLSSIPVVGVPLGIAAAAAAIGSGLANVAKITGIKTGLGKNAAAGFSNLSAGIQTGTKLATGGKKAARGIVAHGTIQGASHANGGVDLGNGIEAEGGENFYEDGNSTYIVNKKASEIINKRGIFGAIDYINQGIGNGVPLNTPTNFAALGGNITSSVKSRAKENFPSDEQQMFKVYNVAEETTSIVNDSIKVENEANL